MTVYSTPPPPDDRRRARTGQPVAPADPLPNKAIAAAVVALITVLAQWLASGEINLDQEGITAIGGAVATLLVYLVSNWTRKGI